MRTTDAPKHWQNKPKEEDKELYKDFVALLLTFFPSLSSFAINQAIKAYRLYLAGIYPTPTRFGIEGGASCKKFERYGPSLLIAVVVSEIGDLLRDLDKD